MMHNVSFFFYVCLAFITFVGTPLQAQESDSGGSAIDSSGVDACMQLFQNSWKPYLELSQYLPKGFKEIPQLPTHKALHMKAEDCTTDPSQAQLLEKALSLHTQRIAIMLPLSQWPKPVASTVQTQVQNLLMRLGFDLKKNLIWVDTGGDPQRLQVSLAQLVFQYHVTALVGGVQLAEAAVLSKWGERLKIPTLLLNRRLKLNASNYIFQVGPSPLQQAASLSRQIQNRALRRVAVLVPQTAREAAMLEALQRLAPGYQLTLDGPYLYNPNDFASLDTHIRNILHLDDSDREQERLELEQKLRDKAKEAGLPFEAQKLILPPKLDIDGLIILDHFKSVHHILKILQFYGVRKLPLFGASKWRAEELLEPFQEPLRGAQFVDYLGSYQRLPYGIKANIKRSEFFVDGDEAGAIDLQVLVSHAAYAAAQLLRGERQARYSLVKLLEQARNENSVFFGQDLVFKKDHSTHWPSFVFTVDQSDLTLTTIHQDLPAQSSISVTKPASSQ